VNIREWMNVGPGRWITLVVALGVLVGSIAYWILRPSGSGKIVEEIQAGGRKIPIYCRACKHTEELRLVWTPTFPMECPKCKAVQAVVAFRCVGCGRLIERKDLPYYTCPHCGKVYDKREGGPAMGP